MTKTFGLSLGVSLLAVVGMLSLSPVAVAQDVDMEPLAIELPDSFDGGTPVDYWGPNLEPENYKDRPPFMAPKGASNVALKKTVTSSEPPVHGALKQVTDGDKHYARTSRLELPSGMQWVQIDLEAEYDIYAILVWHFHEGKRVYFDVVLQVSNDVEFNEGIKTVYNNDHDNSAGLGIGSDKEYIEKYEGRLMPATDVSGRYVRLYGQGNTTDDYNHVVEIEVYGKPKGL